MAHHQLDMRDEWYRGQQATGLSTPQSSTSYTSCDDLERPSWTRQHSSSRTEIHRPRSLEYPRPNPVVAQYGPPHSPPLAHHVKSDLTLPPLRMVLGSPPTPPGGAQSTFKPPMREPLHDFAAPRPMQLYPPPSKRNCTDDYWEGRTSHSSPVSNSASEPRSADSPFSRKDSAQAFHDSQSGRPTPQPAPVADAQHPRPASRPSEHFWAPPAFLQPRLQPPGADGHHSDMHAGRAFHNRPRASPYWGQPTRRLSAHARRPSLVMHQRHEPSAPVAAHQLPYRGEAAAHETHRSEGYCPVQAHLAAPQYGPPEYIHEAAGRMPSSVYDYQSGKSRKRSNLPKHSTEIMKRWFDDHINNPYPTEDQKKYFAAKANINLTQVSNWFINHRRRCPELKDKRDKGQPDGLDDS